jgi:hypothetical protein
VCTNLSNSTSVPDALIESFNLVGGVSASVVIGGKATLSNLRKSSSVFIGMPAPKVEPPAKLPVSKAYYRDVASEYEGMGYTDKRSGKFVIKVGKAIVAAIPKEQGEVAYVAGLHEDGWKILFFSEDYSKTVNGYLKTIPRWGRGRDSRLLQVRGICACEIGEKLANIALHKHPTQRLDKSGNLVHTSGPQAVGYTLEALLKIVPNAKSEPDLHGFEIKVFERSGMGRVTAITTEPDMGFRGANGVVEFLRKYGSPQKGRRNVRVFNGTHRHETRHKKTKLTLRVEQSNIVLIDADGDVASGWSGEKMSAKWVSKHQACIYVPYRIGPRKNLVDYSGYSYICVGSSYEKFLSAVKEGLIVYDPGDSLDGTVKARSQWRLNPNSAVALEVVLRSIYDSVEVVRLGRQPRS